MTELEVLEDTAEWLEDDLPSLSGSDSEVSASGSTVGEAETCQVQSENDSSSENSSLDGEAMAVCPEPRLSMSSTGTEQTDSESNHLSGSAWNGFVIVADNIDKNVRASFQRVDHTTTSLHHVNTYAVKDRVDLSGLSDVPQSQHIDVKSLLPSEDDHAAIRSEFEIFVSRYAMYVTICISYVHFKLYLICSFKLKLIYSHAESWLTMLTST